MGHVVLSRRAVRDLRRIGPGAALTRLRLAFEELGGGTSTPDIKPLRGRSPWHRLRVGDYRVLYRPIEPDETSEPEAAFLVARVIHRRDLERAVGTLE